MLRTAKPLLPRLLQLPCQSNSSKEFPENNRDREMQKQYEGQIAELQKKLQQIEGKVSSPAAGKLPKKLSNSCSSTSKSPAKDSPFSGEPKSDCFWCAALPSVAGSTDQGRGGQCSLLMKSGGRW